MKIALFQTVIPSYRYYLIQHLINTYGCDIYLYGIPEQGLNTVMPENCFRLSSTNIWRFSFFKIPNLSPYDIVILQGNVWHLSNWLILIGSKLYGSRTILFGHGISNFKYSKEILRLSVIRKFYHWLADGVMVYTEDVARKYSWHKRVFSLNNTVVSGCKLYTKRESKGTIRILVCTRFNTVEKRWDIIAKLIDDLDSATYEFHIVGDGTHMTRVERSNVTYYGSIYDESVLHELYLNCHFKLHPGWIGLSAVKSFSYGLPLATLSRNKENFHSVEFHYLSSSTARIADSYELLLAIINETSTDEWGELGLQAYNYYQKNLRPAKQLNKLDVFLNGFTD